MSRGSALLTRDLSILPDNLLELKDKAFYELVKELTSSDEAELLQVQSIRCVHSFMRVNALNIFHLDSNDLAPLQSRLAHKKADGKYAVHVGIRGNLIYLTELFNTFNRLVDTVNITVTPIHSAPSQNASILDATTSGTTSLVDHPSNKTIVSASEHRTHVKQSIKMWWNNVREKYNLVHQNLLEPDDYSLVLTDDSASIICSCGTSMLYAKCYRQHPSFPTVWCYLILTRRIIRISLLARRFAVTKC